MSLGKQIAWALGYDVQLARKSESTIATVFSLLGKSRSDIILDVGANEGQFARSILMRDRGRRVVSFEPIGAAWETMNRSARGFANWHIAPRAAVGAAAGEVTLNVSALSVTSSIFDASAVAVQNFPQSAEICPELVDVARLDVLARPYLKPTDRIYLKVDTQGYEKEVLEGAKELMPQVTAMQLEMCRRPLFEGAPLMPEIMAMAESFGFKLFALTNGFRDRASNELYSLDGFFIR